MTRVAWALLVLAVAPCACHRRAVGRAVGRSAAGVASLVECASECPRDERAPREGGALRIHAESEPAGLCDLVNHEMAVRTIVENVVMETLLEQDATGGLHGNLAASWRLSPDELVLTLRPATFHDGVPLTADDVVFTLELARDPALGADQKSDLDVVSSVEAIDPRTVRLRLRGPAPFLLQALAHLSIYPKHLLRGVDLRTSPFCRAPVGTGPFKLASWESGVAIELVRSDAARAHLERVSFRFVRDRQAALLLYLRGELDVMGRLPLHHDALSAGHRVYRYTPHAMMFALWNARRVPDPRVRAALGHLFDVPRFIATAFDGRARPQSGPFVRGTPSYDPSIEPWPFQPAALAGVDAPKRLRFLVPVGSTASEQLATMLEEDARKAGVAITIEKLDFARVLERLRAGDFDVAAMSLSLAIEQDNFGLFHSGAEQNWGGFTDHDADALLEKIRVTADADARHALDRSLHALLHERGPMTFLVAPEQECAVAPGVVVRPSTDGYDLRHAFRTAP